ncbi:MAG: hypothetical protein JXB14_03120 [Candidatus Altiarchaeota archaeon]|nr:hypothetical protein [Candidatus Altiarchaeota archaeon]
MENKNLIEVYELLLEHFGFQNWWPVAGEGQTKPTYEKRKSLTEGQRLEICIGAILAQNTNWKNVDRVLGDMHGKGLMDLGRLRRLDEKKLASIIRPSGYYNQKAKKLRTFLDFLFKEYGGNVEDFRKVDIDELRAQLRSLWGIGEETADCILLYAAEKPSFVIDAYTKRVFSRMGMLDGIAGYADFKAFFENNLPKDILVYKEFHALIDELAKNYCAVRPRCDSCPVADHCARKID